MNDITVHSIQDVLANMIKCASNHGFFDNDKKQEIGDLLLDNLELVALFLKRKEIQSHIQHIDYSREGCHTIGD